MRFSDSIFHALINFDRFRGRASRSQYWYWQLFATIVTIVAIVFDLTIFPESVAQTFVGIVLFVPTITISIRRLHDVSKSGWWLLLGMVPFVGFILLYWLCLPSTPGHNHYDRNDFFPLDPYTQLNNRSNES